MSLRIRHSIFALLAVGMLSGAAVASAQPIEQNALGCGQMDHQVSDALKAGSQSKNIADARAEAEQGQKFCGLGAYAIGLKHFAKALELLGPSNG
jgi:hypothetical protein